MTTSTNTEGVTTTIKIYAEHKGTWYVEKTVGRQVSMDSRRFATEAEAIEYAEKLVLA